jgi:hypothetical protein
MPLSSILSVISASSGVRMKELLGTMPDAAVAEWISRTVEGVRSTRTQRISATEGVSTDVDERHPRHPGNVLLYSQR